MIELGKIQKLIVIRNSINGVYLNSKLDKDSEDVLLPKNQVPKDFKTGDEIDVFIYKDSEDRIVATTKKPKLTIGQLAILQVVETASVGAFLDWGLEKDLFLPFKEQKERVRKLESYLVGLYIDNSNRLCATTDIHKLLNCDAPFKENERTCGTIYNIIKDVGAFVAVDNKYHGFIPNKELYGNYNCGDVIEVRIKRLRPDGQLELSLRKEAYNEIDDDSKKIFERLKLKGGFLLLNDKSDPTDIKNELNMSKAAFKRAVGRLLKARIIKITDRGIEIV